MALAWGPTRKTYTVAELNAAIRGLLGSEFNDIWVAGEISGSKTASSGHCYFTLKDHDAQLRCVCFRASLRYLKFKPQDGVAVLARGRIDVYETRGEYQLQVEALEPQGHGALQFAFEQLKKKLSAEGLFDAARKRPLPPWPQTIGIATSLSGAVLHDMQQVLARRWPSVRVLVSACTVQGPGAAESVVAALRRLARWTDGHTGRGTDLVILARGGGSMEDLWAFNEEAVVRAVAAHPCPIVVGVGHETDVTLAEFAADVRAATPSVAAELAVPSAAEHAARLHVLGGRLLGAGQRAVARPRADLETERRALEAFRPGAYLASERERVGLLLDRATRAVEARIEVDGSRLRHLDDRLPFILAGRLARARTDLGRSAAGLAALSPFATLERGYAIVRDALGAIVRDAAAHAPGEALDIRLAQGSLDARVERVRDSGT
jgi:exodeoxyribonuclease VII large subunit